MTLSTDPLFKPFPLKNLTLRNRIVMAPMSRQHSPGGVPGVDVAAYYGRRAENGVGLILTEGTIIDAPAAGYTPPTPTIYGEESLKGWKNVVDRVHSADGRIMLQLWHLGALHNPQNFQGSTAMPVSPSGLRNRDDKVGEPMSLADIDTALDAYARGAETAQRVGFDGIELHGAHGYLIDQFFWKTTNLRTDKYGGSIERRSRFGTEVVQECRRRTGPDFPILFRFSQWKVQDYTAPIAESADELGRLLQPLAAAGVDLFDCSTRRFWEPAFAGNDLNLAGWTKKLTGKPTIAIGSITLNMGFVAMRFKASSDGVPPSPGLERLMELLARGDFDLIAVGRALLADPLWASKVREGKLDELRPYSKDLEQSLF
jgi:2,4-dienoyl-CoA reductase-like NADH-dependent reductase (Old Yellow Enzyme family)